MNKEGVCRVEIRDHYFRLVGVCGHPQAAHRDSLEPYDAHCLDCHREYTDDGDFVPNVPCIHNFDDLALNAWYAERAALPVVEDTK